MDIGPLRVYDSGGGDLCVFWHHGTPNTGAPPEPLMPAAAERGIRWLSYDRPGYGGSAPRPGRTVGSASGDVLAIADALGIERFAVMGHSGGAPHALASAALLGDRVLGAVCVSGLAPWSAEDLDWYAGMGPAGSDELRAAAEGRGALEACLASSEFDPELFTPSDHATLTGPWSWLSTVVGEALAGGLDGMVDDDLAYVAPWGFEPGHVAGPVLFVHGVQDRVVPAAHSTWLARRCPSASLWLRPDDGHISVLNAAVDALDWLVDRARRG